MHLVTVISDTVQEFRGERYYRCGRYFQRKGRRLHREVWVAANGRPVPRGYAVHHADHDTAHNQPGNLVLLASSAHARHHGLDRADVSGAHLEAARDAARVWHGSDEGRAWHRDHYERVAGPALTRREPRACAHCGAEYDGVRQGKYCGNNCKSAARRASGADIVERTCAICGAAFRVNRYWTTQTCGRSCGRRLARSQR